MASTFTESPQKNEENPLEGDVLIVDECSMMDMWLAYQLFSRLKPGTKVLLVGDADQLESVGAGSVFRSAGLISSRVTPCWGNALPCTTVRGPVHPRRNVN